jgi:hypothetical protein
MHIKKTFTSSYYTIHPYFNIKMHFIYYSVDAISFVICQIDQTHMMQLFCIFLCVGVKLHTSDFWLKKSHN